MRRGSDRAADADPVRAVGGQNVTGGRYASAVDAVRILHLLECPARDVAERRIKAVCTCPAERFLDPWAEPIPEAVDFAETPAPA